MSDAGTVALGPGEEFDRLRAVFRRLGSLVSGVGDDAALVSVGGVPLAFSCDLVIEDQHFRLGWLTAEEIGWRAAAAALSDLAAVAAEPLGLLAAVGVPAERSGAFFEELMAGVAAAAGSVGASVWGGDLVRADKVTLDITVVGRADRPVRRRGAREGDGLWITGLLGGPEGALAAWTAGAEPEPALRERFARPVPRVREAAWLRDHGANAMIDVSDGLAGDAGHLAAASAVCVEIETTRVPVHPAVRDPRSALVGGEEYELLVTLPPGFGEREVAAFAEEFEVPLTRVGIVRVGQGVVLVRDGVPMPPAGGFSHF